eukprot:2932686-Alexandrium_andersonii.AAC.1
MIEVLDCLPQVRLTPGDGVSALCRDPEVLRGSSPFTPTRGLAERAPFRVPVPAGVCPLDVG